MTKYNKLKKGTKMPFVNVKLVKEQILIEKKRQIIEGLTDLVVTIMNRERSLTTIVIDQIESDAWAIGGRVIDPQKDFVSFVNIKVSKGTTDSKEMSTMMKETKTLMASILGNHVEENYFIIDELNPSGWGFDGISMTERSRSTNL
jgi:4-oxalocrotonate tautomerase